MGYYAHMEQMILLLTQTAKMVGISPQLLIAICMAETNLRHIHTPNDGKTNSYGVCQVKLETAHFMGKVHKKPHLTRFTSDDMKDINKNMKVAALYVKYQINRYDGDLCKAVAAYNAGSFKESKKYPGKPFNWRYVEKVQKNLEDYPDLQSSLECESIADMLALN
jgi:soluble lytic murein transglycosylase-like protein